jgi:hypothetical protein
MTKRHRLDRKADSQAYWLKMQYPEDESIRVSHETIYRMRQFVSAGFGREKYPPFFCFRAQFGFASKEAPAWALVESCPETP